MTVVAQLKATKIGAGGLAWMMSFVLADVTTGQALVAAFFATISAVLAAWLATRPAIIRERNQKEMSDEDRHVKWLEQRIYFHSQQVVLVRQSKHNCLGYIESCHAYIRKLQEMVGGDAPPFEFKYHDDLCGDEDRGMAQIVHAGIHTTGEMPRMGGDHNAR
jgi:hypothetical protein